MESPEREHPGELDRYARLLAEAKTIRGTSLAADGWRRLKKNRVALACLGFLVVLSLLAFFTPLLPLQSPFETHAERENQYTPPAVWPLMIDGLKLPADIHAAKGPSAEEMNDWIDAEFGSLNRLNRWMVVARVKLFGSWSINSICGRDELGRDMFARLFWGRGFRWSSGWWRRWCRC